MAVNGIARCVEGNECLRNLVGDAQGIACRVPDVRFHTGGMSVSFVFMGMALITDKVYALRQVEESQMRSVGRQAFHPCLLKTDVADTQIADTFRQVHQLPGRRVVCFGTGTAGHHTYHAETVASQCLGKVSQRFNGNGNKRTLVVGSFLCRFGT